MECCDCINTKKATKWGCGIPDFSVLFGHAIMLTAVTKVSPINPAVL